MQTTHYIKVVLQLPEALREPAMALLTEAEYEAFEETSNGVEAYITEALFDQGQLEESLSVFDPTLFSYQVEKVPVKNWNQEWEATFEAIYIGQFCQVIASFKQPQPDFLYTVVIDPKMAFGTGHHETTRMMIRQMEHLPLSGKKVLDMGCGTGILAILAAKMGAASVKGIDIDPWSYENSVENAALNDVPEVEFLVGDVSAISGETYEVILANINRNVLTQDVAEYARCLAPGGTLLVSGFFREDAPVILEAFSRAGLSPQNEIYENQWLSISFIQNQHVD